MAIFCVFRKSVTLFIGLALMACSPPVPKAYVPPNPQEKFTDFSAELYPMVDILFVIASDSSMGSFQSTLVANASRFTAEIIKAGFLDYHIGVINAQADDQGMGNAWGGRLNGFPPFIDRSTKNGDLILQQNMQVGINSNDPVSLFATVRAALTAPTMNNENKGFLRPNASLAIVMISDTDPENSGEDANVFYNFLVSLKGGDPKRVFAYAATASLTDPSCPGESELILVNQVLALAKPNSLGFSLCDPDFGTKLAEMSKNIVNNIDHTLYLGRIPILESIEVTYGSQVIPPNADTGWSFDPNRNAIILGRHLVFSSAEPPGTRIQVKYMPTQHKNK